MFSGFYLALLLILVALIMRGVAFEYRGKGTAPPGGAAGTWRSSPARLLPAHAVGRRLRQHRCAASRWTPRTMYTGNFLTLLNLYSLLGGLATLSLFTLHGAVFLALQDHRGAAQRARRDGGQVAGLAAVAAAAVFLAVTEFSHRAAGHGHWRRLRAVAAVAPVGAGRWRPRPRQARAGRSRRTRSGLALAVATLFSALYPNVMPSTTSAAYSLTVTNASSTAQHAGGDELGRAASSRRSCWPTRAGPTGSSASGWAAPPQPPAAARRRQQLDGGRP